VSRRFKGVTDAQLDELMSRDLSELDLAALMLDGVDFADACCVVAVAIGADGTKVPVGLWLGDTENKTVVTALLADLIDRGLNTDGGLLVVIDGAKALATAVRKVSGDTAFIQRCTLHKRRNVRDHLPKDQQAWVDCKLAAAFNHDDPAKGERACRTSPRSSGRVGPMRRRACAKASRTCSPSGGSMSAAGSPRASRTPTASRA
jgi:transposase-like protein